jgi:two-component system phosphate regulon sensor histidine kinase PhoR
MKRFRLNLSLTSVIVILAVGVLLPVILSTAVGIVTLAIAKDASGIAIGVLVICFAVTAAGCALIAVVLAGRKNRLARDQADFLANMSHELRTPLSAIRLYAQTLQSDKVLADPAQVSKCLETIVRETEWLDVMIDKVLTWRTSSKDSIELDMEIGSVSTAVQGAADRFCAMVAADEMAFSTSIDTRLAVSHDARSLNSVVLNLLTNAYKYTRDNRRIGLRAYDKDSTVVVEVSDNGIGLSAKAAKRVFKPFYRAKQDAGERAGGVGLGLAIARHLVRRHRGTIEVRSTEGEGCTFVVVLPEAVERDE